MKSFYQNFINNLEYNSAEDLLYEKPYVEVTNNIEINVWPEYITKKSTPQGDIFIWAYHILISNKSIDIVKLTHRYWRIIDEAGNIQEVDDEGVVGEKPEIKPDSSFQYTSAVHLKLPSGIMMGKYKMQKLTNNDSKIEQEFSAIIPAFSLDLPNNKKILN